MKDRMPGARPNRFLEPKPPISRICRLLKEWMRFERVRKVLLDPHHLGRFVTVHRATDIAFNAERAIELWNRHVSICKAKRYAVFEQEVVH